MVETVIQGKTRKRRELCAFYTHSDPIVTYMVSRLQVEHGDRILEPCAGDGVFIERILRDPRGTGSRIHAVELNSQAVERLRDKFKNHANVTVQEADMLVKSTDTLFEEKHELYTKIIGNPPYGAWQDQKRRQLLKKIYGGYVRETYGLFIRKCIELLEEGGRLVFIVPDTFLALHLHAGLRRYLVSHTKIEEITLIPSKFFPGVSFGYSNLCIITLVKSKHPGKNIIRIVSLARRVDALYEVANGNYGAADSVDEINQDDVGRWENTGFMVGCQGNKKIRVAVGEAATRLGDMADCVTGFYSGDDRQFLRVRAQAVKHAVRYREVPEAEVSFDFAGQEKILSGLSDGKKYVPLLKGGGTRPFVTGTDWFMRWDSEAVEFYKRDPKARFQNSQYYFREGIGIPMVKTRRIRAFFLQNRLFDQSVVGVFPKKPENLNYLLAFLNSIACTKMLMALNHTANNSANYVKRIPVIIESAAVAKVEAIMERFWKGTEVREILVEIDEVFGKLFGI